MTLCQTTTFRDFFTTELDLVNGKNPELSDVELVE